MVAITDRVRIIAWAVVLIVAHIADVISTQAAFGLGYGWYFAEANPMAVGLIENGQWAAIYTQKALSVVMSAGLAWVAGWLWRRGCCRGWALALAYWQLVGVSLMIVYVALNNTLLFLEFLRGVYL